MRLIYLFALVFVFPFVAFTQNAKVSGRVFNAINNEPIFYAKISVVEVSKGGMTDEKGQFVIEGLSPGIYSIKAI